MSDDSPALPSAPKPKRVYRKRSHTNVLRDAGIERKPGALSTTELSSITAIVSASTNELVPAQIDAIATTLRRDPKTVAKYVEAARDTFAKNANEYANIHMQIARKAAESNEPRAFETARKAAEFSMQHTSTKDADGNEIRVISSPAMSSNAPVIKIGIALGGLPSAKRDDDQ